MSGKNMRCMEPLKADVVVIGGGAAGSMCAFTAAQRGLSVVLLEPNKMLGKKLRITGKGRCNVTNNCDIKTVLANIPGDGRFLYSALNRFEPRDTMALFESLGVPLKTACFRSPTARTTSPMHLSAPMHTQGGAFCTPLRPIF